VTETRQATGLEFVIAVKVIPPYTLEVTFDDGAVRKVDVEPALRGPIFEPLRDPAYFAQVVVNDEYGTVVWPNGADLAPEFLYKNGAPTCSTSLPA
jgi:hypothetical protein